MTASLRVTGVHPYPVTPAMIADLLEERYGDGLSLDERAEAEAQVREELGRLFIIEVEGESLDQDYPWGEITQEDLAEPRENWQAAYDERPTSETGDRWAFFFHYLDLGRPLLSPAGPVHLPKPSTVPPHLRDVRYEAP